MSGSPLFAWPSVLITVLPRVTKEEDSLCAGTSNSEEPPIPLSGSGFLFGEDSTGSTLLVTAASWLSSVLDIYSEKDGSSHRTMWRHHSDIGPYQHTPLSLVVLLEAKSLGSRRTHQTEATISAVCQMKDIYSALKEGLESMSHWRVAVGDSSKAITQSLVLPLSCVVLLKLNTPLKIRPSCDFTISPSSLTVGQAVVAMGTPFGGFCPEVFLNCVVPGTINKTIGSGRQVCVIDASLPGEGSLVAARESSGASRIEVLGMTIAGLSSVTGQPSGLSLVCSAHSVWTALAHCDVKTNFFLQSPISLASQALSSTCSRLMESVVVVLKEGQWGSGVLLSNSVVLTCGHVAGKAGKGDAKASIVMHRGSKLKGVVIASSSLPDYAIIKLEKPTKCITSALLSLPNQPSSNKIEHTPSDTPFTTPCCGPTVGRSVCIIGYCYQDPYRTDGTTMITPLVTRGAVIKVVRGESGEVVMFATTAVLLPGMSGGLVIDELTEEPLGIAVSNSKDLESGSSYPRLNYCLPFTWVLPSLLQFLRTNTPSCLETLNSSGKKYHDIWKLTPNYKLCSKL